MFILYNSINLFTLANSTVRDSVGLVENAHFLLHRFIDRYDGLRQVIDSRYQLLLWLREKCSTILCVGQRNFHINVCIEYVSVVSEIKVLNGRQSYNLVYGHILIYNDSERFSGFVYS